MQIITFMLLVVSATAAFAEVEFVGMTDTEVRVGRDHYGLSDVELQRLAYLKSIDQPFAQNLSPIELLGKYAQTDHERDHYAQVYASLMADQMQRAQSWALAVAKATQETDYTQLTLAGATNIITGLERLGLSAPTSDAHRDQYLTRQQNRKAGQTLFVSLDCASACDRAIKAAVPDTVTAGSPSLDIVFVGAVAADESAIIDWIRRQQIAQSVLNSGKILLHIDSDYWRERRDGDRVPQVIRQ